MSGLYNLLFGKSPFSHILMEILGLKEDDVPRFRDCYLNEDGHIVIYTRTGGGNREYYDSPESDPEYSGPYNSDLRTSPHFIGDEDDSFDSTYAYFKFKVPDAAKETIGLLGQMGSVRDPHKAWDDLLTKLQAGVKDEDTARAISVGEKILKNIREQLK